jgi:zona occludens toxin (predicted ATPase)
MEFKLNLNLQKTKTSKAQVVSAVASTWQKSYELVLLAFLVAAFVFGWYVWHANLSGNTWDEARKQEFLKTQNSGVVFDQKNFEKVQADIELRKKESAAGAQDAKDIFKAY